MNMNEIYYGIQYNFDAWYLRKIVKSTIESFSLAFYIKSNNQFLGRKVFSILLSYPFTPTYVYFCEQAVSQRCQCQKFSFTFDKICFLFLNAHSSVFDDNLSFCFCVRHWMLSCKWQTFAVLFDTLIDLQRNFCVWDFYK